VAEWYVIVGWDQRTDHQQGGNKNHQNHGLLFLGLHRSTFAKLGASLKASGLFQVRTPEQPSPEVCSKTDYL